MKRGKILLCILAVVSLAIPALTILSFIQGFPSFLGIGSSAVVIFGFVWYIGWGRKHPWV